MDRTYIAIDLKSFYASVECAKRQLDPFTTNLVVADPERTEKTICLAVSPALRSFGVSSRARLFEVLQRVKEINIERRNSAPGRRLVGSSSDITELEEHPELEMTFIIAPPHMSRYMEQSTQINAIYMQYVSPEDMLVYSVDEVFLDVTAYLSAYDMTAHELALMIVREVYHRTGITATAGIGTNMYLAKIAMDIMAKKMPADEDGVRIAELDEASYRRFLWNHTPLTDFWRVGRGYAKKLEQHGLYTMGDIARCSLGEPPDFHCEELLYKLFGVNAELLIDHAWGWEPVTIADSMSYTPQNNSVSIGQVLQEPYTAEMAKLIAKEMTDLLVLDLVDKGMITGQMVLDIGYDVECLTNPDIRNKYHGEVTTDHYGRKIPKHAHGTINLSEQTSSTRVIMEAVMELFDRIINPDLLVRRLNVVACQIVPLSEKKAPPEYVQMDLFTDYEEEERQKQDKKMREERERYIQQAVLDIKKKYGKNAVLKGMNLQNGATTIQRNAQIGGHKA